ncbi:MAG TPA: cytochrome c [Bryobacteraceae bacterium]|nr:cytochrome c [Bryobacteraceae bacterium]
MRLRTRLIGLAAAGWMAALYPAGAWAADAAAGKAVYDAKCKTCHGASGEGNPAIGKAMKVEMKALGSTTADVKKVITEGQGKMKPVASVTGADLDNVVAYVHSLKK